MSLQYQHLFFAVNASQGFAIPTIIIAGNAAIRAVSTGMPVGYPGEAGKTEQKF